MYPTIAFPATLPLDHPGLAGVRAPRPAPVGAGQVGGLVAVRVADLVARSDQDGSDVLVPARAGVMRDGDLVVWCRVVAVAPASVDSPGRPAADGWLPDHVRLGLLEEHLGPGVIEQVVAETSASGDASAAATQTGDPAVQADAAAGSVRPSPRRRVMSLPLTARLVLLLALTPYASYVECFAQLVGTLRRVPWTRAWQVPSSTVITGWRRRLGTAPMRALFWKVAGPVVAVTEPGGAWHGLRVGAIDGTLVRVPDSPANRAAFGATGTADGSGPFPQVRLVKATARAGRAIVAAAFDSATVGEQPLTDRLVTAHPDLLAAPGWVWLMDRNFPGFELIDAIHRCGRGAHLVIRMPAGIKLPVLKRLSAKSYLSRLRSRDRRRQLPVRVIEYEAMLTDVDHADGKQGNVSELYCLITTLLDLDTYPDDDLPDLYHQRWSAAETSIGEGKRTITDAGPSRGPILRSKEPDLVRQEIWAWLAAIQLVRKAAATATRTAPVPLRNDQISFTAMRREAVRSVAQSLITATTPAGEIAVIAQAANQQMLANLVTTDRQRHSARRQKHKPALPHTASTKPTRTGRRTVTIADAPDPPDTS